MSEEALHDAIVRDSLQIQRLTAGEQARLAPLMDQLASDLRALIEGGNLTEAGKREIAALIRQADDMIAGTYQQAATLVDAVELAKVVAERTQTVLISALPGVIAQMPTANVLASLASNVMIQGSPASAWWAKQSEDLSFRFAAQVRQGVANAEPVAKIVQRIVGRQGEPGIMEVSRTHARTLVHSSVQAVMNDARLATFRKNSDIIKGVRQVSTLDSHTSNICIAYSGAEWDLDGKPMNRTTLPFNGGPPRHWGCRSVLVPITKSFRELGVNLPDLKPTTRASKDGQIDARTSFSAFLDRQTTAFQDEVLGKGRAALWRAGKITLRDLVSGNGRPLTLDQLRKQAGE